MIEGGNKASCLAHPAPTTAPMTDSSTRVSKVDASSLPSQYYQMLVDNSQLITQNPETRRELRLFDVKVATCTARTREQVCTPEFFAMFKDYFHDAKEDTKNSKKLNTEDGKKLDAANIARSLVEPIPFFSLYSLIGEKVRHKLKQLGSEVLFLDTPLPVTSRESQIIFMKKFIQRSHIAETFISMGWNFGYFKCLKEISKYDDTVPTRVSPLPNKPWLNIIRQVLSEVASESGIDIDFTKTPFFLNFIKPSIADDVAKSFLFFENPSSGNISHGILSHPIQVLFLSRKGIINNSVLSQIIDKDLWSIILDLDPNYHNYTSVVVTSSKHDIVLRNYDSLLNGRFPNSVQAFLCSGMSSAFIDQQCNTVEATRLHKLFELPIIESTALLSLETHIKNIRTLEYAVAGVTFDLGDLVANAASRTLNPISTIGKLEQLYTCLSIKSESDDQVSTEDFEPHSWDEFDMSNSRVIAMGIDTAVEYFSERQPYDVYIQVFTREKKYKLKKAESEKEIRKEEHFVVFPEGVSPPDSVLYKPQSQAAVIFPQLSDRCPRQT